MKQEVRNVGKFSASTPSSGSNYLLYSIVVSKVLKKFRQIIHSNTNTCKIRGLIKYQDIR